MPTARYALGAATGLDGRIYTLGGLEGEGNNSHETGLNEVFDPSTNTWTTAAPMPSPRVFFAAAAGLDGRIYAIGGAESVPGSDLSRVAVYDPASDTWRAGAPMPTARRALAAVTGKDGRI